MTDHDEIKIVHVVMDGNKELFKTTDLYTARYNLMICSEEILSELLPEYDCFIEFLDSNNSINIVGRERMQFNIYNRILREIRLLENEKSYKPVEYFTPC